MFYVRSPLEGSLELVGNALSLLAMVTQVEFLVLDRMSVCNFAR